MKRLKLILVLFLLLSPALSRAEKAPVPDPRPDPRSMRFDPIVFQPPKPDRVKLSNGMILYLIEDHELPLIDLQIMIRTGSIYEPAEKIGLASLTGRVMRSGGTLKHPSAELNDILDQIAANLSVGIGNLSGSASLNTLKKDFDLGLGLLAEVLRQPAFEAEKVEIAKNRALESIRRRNDRAASVASREFWKQVYGADSPYGREATAKTIKAISREDLVAFQQKYFAPNNMIVGITGDFKKDEMILKIEQAFADWPQKEVVFPEVPPVRARKSGAVYKITKAIPQTQVRMGHLGIRQKNPDFYALSVMNDILGGGGMANRLFQDIRTKQGLAYSVGTVMRPGKIERGVFLAYGATRTEKTHQAMESMMKHIQKIREEPVLDEELKRAKEAFLNSFIFSFSSTAQIVGRQMSLEYFGLPEDYLVQYRDNVAKVTKTDILRVAQRYLHPDRLIIMVVGDESRFDKPLSSFGKVEEITLSP